MIPPVANCRQITAICQKFITSCFGLTAAVVGLIIKMCNFLHILQKALITGFLICDFFTAFWRLGGKTALLGAYPRALLGFSGGCIFIKARFYI